MGTQPHRRAPGGRRDDAVARRARVRAALLRWYDANRRDLPWRRTRDPYAIWLSETMLQQTRVETVIPYWERFLETFPDVKSLARADADEVLGMWAGLGYYSRARNLHAAARRVADEHAGAFPADVDALRELPGVGRYTAGALASIAFDLPAPIVDGNVARVFSRLHGIREDIKAKDTEKRLWEEAEAIAEGERPGDLNQAVMELGALVCTPRSPLCTACPLFAECDARQAGDADALPVKAKKKKPKKVAGVAAWIERRGRVLAVRRPPEGLLGGLWELPSGELEKGEQAEDGLRRTLAERVGLEAVALEKLGEVEHVFTHRVLRLQVYRVEVAPGRVRRRDFDAHRWCAPTALRELPQATVSRKAIALGPPD